MAAMAYLPSHGLLVAMASIAFSTGLYCFIWRSPSRWKRMCGSKDPVEVGGLLGARAGSGPAITELRRVRARVRGSHN